MIVSGLLDLVKSGLLYVISLLPDLSAISLPSGITSWFHDIIASVGYFLPMPDLALMFGIFIAVTYFHVFYNLIMRIWDALPFT